MAVAMMTAVTMPMTMVPAVAMAAMTTMPASRGWRHGGSTECARGDDSE